MQALVAERSCRELVGARAVNGKYPQKWGAEPEHGLAMAINCRVLRRQGDTFLKPPFHEWPDIDFSHATLALHLLGYWLAQVKPDTAELPFFLIAYQDWRQNFAPNQIWKIERIPDLAPALLEHLRTVYRYDLTTFPIHHIQRDWTTPAAQVVRPAAGAAGIPFPTRTRSTAPLFGPEVSEERASEGS